MIAIPRSLARQFRAVFRKSAPVGSPRGLKPQVVLEASRQGLSARMQLPDVAVEYHQAGTHAPDTLALPLDALDDFGGRQDIPITLEKDGENSVQARWDDGGIPQVRQYVAGNVENQRPFPEVPARFAPLDPVVLPALDAGRQCVARDGVRFALQKLQLRGSTGEIVSSDGRQLLVQRGFPWPWKEDVLVPAVPIFGGRELTPDGPLSIGRTATHVVFRVGPWTFFLAIDAEGRYPKVEQVIPSLTGTHTTCRLSPDDHEFLAQTLPRLPGGDDEDSPITIDLNGHVAVRARAANQDRATELVLSRSTVDGPPVRFVSGRQYLARMVQLGFDELKVVKADAPVVCLNATKKFIWVPLGKEGAVPPGDHLRITSTGKAPKTSPVKRERRIIPMHPPSGNSSKNGHVASSPPASSEAAGKTSSIDGLIEEAAELKSLLRDAYVRVGQLLEGLKRQRHHSRLLRSTLTTLKQLQQFPE